ncbi:MAG: DUF2029 domain-containing protein [Acidobacteria bacterium]|nr:DUF2029 domain-containing protein [Acidobacteriota bacterium]
MNIHRITTWILIFALAALFVFKTDRGYLAAQIDLGDFLEYWSAGRIFLSDGNPYSSSELLRIQQRVGLQRPSPAMMWSPPWAILFMLPFTLLPFGIARGIFLLFEIAIIAFAACRLWTKFGGSKNKLWIGVLGAFLFLPSLLALHQGQINILVLGGLIAFLWAIETKRNLIGGLATIAIALKPHLIHLFYIFLLFWSWKVRRWRTLIWAFTLLSFSISILCVINPKAVLGYITTLETSPGPLEWLTPSSGVALMLLTSSEPNLIRFVPMTAAWILAILLCYRSLPEAFWSKYLNLILLLSMATTPFCWTSDWVVLLPVVIQTLVWFSVNPSRNWWIVAALGFIQFAIIFTAFNLPNYNEVYNFWVPFALWAVYWLGNKTNRIKANALSA